MYLETSGDATFTALIEQFHASDPQAKAGVRNFRFSEPISTSPDPA